MRHCRNHSAPIASDIRPLHLTSALVKMLTGALHASGCPSTARSPLPARQRWRTPLPVCHAASPDSSDSSTVASCTRRELGVQAARLAALTGLAGAAPAARPAPARAAELTLQDVTPQVAPVQPLTARRGPPSGPLVHHIILVSISRFTSVKTKYRVPYASNWWAHATASMVGRHSACQLVMGADPAQSIRRLDRRTDYNSVSVNSPVFSDIERQPRMALILEHGANSCTGSCPVSQSDGAVRRGLC